MPSASVRRPPSEGDIGGDDRERRDEDRDAGRRARPTEVFVLLDEVGLADAFLERPRRCCWASTAVIAPAAAIASTA